MTDPEPRPGPPRGVPTWIWGCGGGCLLSLALLIAATWFGMNQVLSSIGPEKAWPVVAEVLPYGQEPPPRYRATLIDFDALAQRPLVRRLMQGLELDQQEVEALGGQQVILLQEEFSSDKPAGTGSMALLWRLPEGGDVNRVPEPLVFQSGEQAEASQRSLEIELQGRRVGAIAYVTEGHQSPFAPQGRLEILEVDLTGERSRPLLLKLLSSGEQRADEAELRRFLEPFAVWEGR
jgi:hypothetical protein